MGGDYFRPCWPWCWESCPGSTRSGGESTLRGRVSLVRNARSYPLRVPTIISKQLLPALWLRVR